MATRNKKWWIIHCSAGVAAIMLIVFGMKQCTDKKSERAEKEEVRNTYIDARNQINRDVVVIDSLLNANRDLGDDNRAKSDTIRMQRDTIADLRDSLKDCRDGKQRCPGKRPTPARQTPPVRPTPQKPVVVHDTVVVVTQVPAPASQNNNGSTVVNISGNSDNNKVNINNGVINYNYGTPAQDTVKLAAKKYGTVRMQMVQVKHERVSR